MDMEGISKRKVKPDVMQTHGSKNKKKKNSLGNVSSRQEAHDLPFSNCINHPKIMEISACLFT